MQVGRRLKGIGRMAERKLRGAVKQRRPGGGRPSDKTPRLIRATDAPDQEAVPRRAYELHLRRGGAEGHQAEDWLEAEAQVRAEAARRATVPAKDQA